MNEPSQRPTPEVDEHTSHCVCGATDSPNVVTRDFAINLKRQRDEAREALEKINAIRNSVIAHQSCNFSEHVYPLVAALNEAGIQGMGYPDAVAYYGPVTERCAKAEKDRDEAREQVSKLVASLEWIRANSKTHEGRRAERDLRDILAETKDAK